MSSRTRLASAVAAAARRLASGARTPAAGLPAAFEWAAGSSSAPGLSARTARFPWGKVSLGFAAAGLMTVADAPTAGCTAEAAKVASPPPSAAPGGAASGASTHKVVFVLGGPGSGKGTQCAKLVEEFGLTHLSAGDLLRAHMKSGSPEGQMVADMIKQGQIVPSRVTISLLQHAMDASGQHRFLIDGFPRNEENRGSFENQTGISPELVLFFDCPESVMEARLLRRNEGRTDDNIETIRKRFKVFLDSTLPIIQHYEARGKVARINADRSADDIFKEVRRLFLEM